MQAEHKEPRSTLDSGVPLDPQPLTRRGLLGFVRVRGCLDCSDHGIVEAAGDEVRQKPKPSSIVSGKLRERLQGLEYLGSKRKAKESLGRLLAGSRVWISSQ